MAKKKGKNKSSESKTVEMQVMSEEELKDMSYNNLRKLAKKWGYSGRNLKTEEYIEFILENQSEDAVEEGHEEPGLSDAVSEVIGDKKGDDRKIPKKFKTALLKYQQTEGLDTSELEDLMENGSVKDIREGFKEFEESMDKMEGLKKELEDIDVQGLEDEAKELRELLTDPNNLEEARQRLKELKFKQEAKGLKEELDKMVLPAMKGRVDDMKARLEKKEDLESVIEDMNDLRRDYKEAYAEEGIMAHVADESTRPADKTGKIRKKSMIVKDIFLLYKDGRFISHHTNRVVSKDQQKILFADLKTGRNFLRSPKYVPQKLNDIPIEKRHILVQSGKFTVVIMITEGAVDPWTERIISKVLNLMEKEDAMALRSWNGEVASLKSSGKYMQALLFACMKLSKKGK